MTNRLEKPAFLVVAVPQVEEQEGIGGLRPFRVHELHFEPPKTPLGREWFLFTCRCSTSWLDKAEIADIVFDEEK